MLNETQEYLLNTILEEYISYLTTDNIPIDMQYHALVAIQNKKRYLDFFIELKDLKMLEAINVLKDILQRKDSPHYLSLTSRNEPPQVCSNYDVYYFSKRIIDQKTKAIHKQINFQDEGYCYPLLKRLFSLISYWTAIEKEEAPAVLQLRNIQREFEALISACKRNFSGTKAIENFLKSEFEKPYCRNVLEDSQPLPSLKTTKFHIKTSNVRRLELRLNLSERLLRHCQKIINLEKMKKILAVQTYDYRDSESLAPLINTIDDQITELQTYDNAQLVPLQANIIECCRQLLNFSTRSQEAMRIAFAKGIGKAISKHHPSLEKKLRNLRNDESSYQEELELYSELQKIKDETWSLGLSYAIIEIKQIIKINKYKQTAITVGSTVYGALGGTVILLASMHLFSGMDNAIGCLMPNCHNQESLFIEIDLNNFINTVALAPFFATHFTYTNVSSTSGLVLQGIFAGVLANVFTAFLTSEIYRITQSIGATLLPTTAPLSVAIGYQLAKSTYKTFNDLHVELDETQRELLEESILPILTSLNEAAKPVHPELHFLKAKSGAERYKLFALRCPKPDLGRVQRELHRRPAA